MFAERCIVDNRIFLLGLDKLYRDAMQRHEREELLLCARRVADELHVRPADVPVEGYYSEDQELTDYFLLMRALQACDEGLKPAVSAIPQFQRLEEVTSAPLYGRPQWKGKLLPTGRDPLSQALLDTPPPEWSVKRLADASCLTAQDTDDISLVGLAALIRDPVVLAATRESVVLYAEMMVGAAPGRQRPKYVWKVDKEIVDRARRFIGTFNALFGPELPPAESGHAESYWHAYRENDILGRCVRLGYDNGFSPVRHYHWAICLGPDGSFLVQEFWKPEVWTTERYRSMLGNRGQGPEL